MPVFGVSANLKILQKTMFFVDGTNLLYRLDATKLIVPSLYQLLCSAPLIGGREILRIYFYTVQCHVEAALKKHGDKFFDNIRVVLGDQIALNGGNFKEKGVDALLVADLIYHSASKNCDCAVLVSVDTDFCHAISRVEDFGCSSAVLGVCSEIPERLKNKADKSYVFRKEEIIAQDLGS